MKFKPLFLIGLVLVGLFFIYFGRVQAPKGSLESIRVSESPWSAEDTHLRERLAAINLPALTAEGQALHIHQHLDIVVHGKAVTVPSDIGVHKGADAFISSIHTHDLSGVIHVESPTIEKFYLGQFFDIWGVRLSDACIGGYCADTSNTFTVYVNGVKYEGDPRTLELAAHQEIVLVYGTQAEAPAQIPNSYTFPEGE